MGKWRDHYNRVHAVIVGCQHPDGRWLHIRRSQQVVAPGKICLPGGAMETGETQQETAIRETREELGVGIKPIRCVWNHTYEDKPLALWAWLAELQAYTFRINQREVAETIWLTTEQGICHHETLPYHD